MACNLYPTLVLACSLKMDAHSNRAPTIIAELCYLCPARVPLPYSVMHVNEYMLGSAGNTFNSNSGEGTGNLKPELGNRVPLRLHFFFFFYVLMLFVDGRLDKRLSQEITLIFQTQQPIQVNSAWGTVETKLLPKRFWVKKRVGFIQPGACTGKVICYSKTDSDYVILSPYQSVSQPSLIWLSGLQNPIICILKRGRRIAQ